MENLDKWEKFKQPMECPHCGRKGKGWFHPCKEGLYCYGCGTILSPRQRREHQTLKAQISELKKKKESRG